nr:hypothetical protein [Angustibacter aerolatus]
MVNALRSSTRAGDLMAWSPVPAVQQSFTTLGASGSLGTPDGTTAKVSLVNTDGSKARLLEPGRHHPRPRAPAAGVGAQRRARRGRRLRAQPPARRRPHDPPGSSCRCTCRRRPASPACASTGAP